MPLEDIIILAIAIVVVFLIIRFITRIFFKLIGVLIVIAFAVYLLFFWRGGLLDIGNENFILNELKAKYCTEQPRSAKCECIIEPIYQDIRQKYTEKEIEELQKHKAKSMAVILNSARKKREEIRICLKESNSENQWDEFVDDLKDSDVKQKFKDKIESLH